jgi:hypothetical protein
MAILIYILTNGIQRFPFLYILANMTHFVFFIITILTRVKWYLIVVLFAFSWWQCWIFFIYLLAIPMSSIEKGLFCLIFNCLSSLLLLILWVPYGLSILTSFKMLNLVWKRKNETYWNYPRNGRRRIKENEGGEWIQLWYIVRNLVNVTMYPSTEIIKNKKS